MLITRAARVVAAVDRPRQGRGDSRSKAARTYARRTTACATARRRARAKRPIPPPRTSGFAASYADSQRRSAAEALLLARRLTTMS